MRDALRAGPGPAFGGAAAARGADQININGQLVLAARAGGVQRVAQLLADGASVNRDRNGDSPLNMAAPRGQRPRRGPAAAHRAGRAAGQPRGRHAAGRRPRQPQLRKLLAAGARTDPVDRVRKTAAVYAAGQGRIGRLEQLLGAGMPVNANLDHDLTLLMWSAGYGQEAAARLLLEPRRPQPARRPRQDRCRHRARAEPSAFGATPLALA